MRIDDIIDALKALQDGENLNRRSIEMFMAAELLGHEKFQIWTRHDPFGSITADLSRARRLFKLAFPGWLYRLC